MKANRIIALFTFLMGLSLQAQGPELSADPIVTFLFKMIDKAPPAIPNNATSCNLAAKINQEEISLGFVMGMSPIGKMDYGLIASDMSFNHHSYQYIGSYDRGEFASLHDKSLSAYAESNGFIAFVSNFAGKNMADLNPEEEKELRGHYDYMKRKLSNKASLWDPFFSGKIGSCSFDTKLFRTVKEFKFPNVTFEYSIEFTSKECPCIPEGDATEIKNAFFTISCTSVESVLTDRQGPLGDPINPRIDIISEECCSAKKEEENYSARNDANDDIVAFAFDYDWAGDGFSITVGGGPTIGDESDFFGFSYSGDLGYLHKVSDRFQIGATAGYTRYTGKETDFGFETEGESFIPIKAKASYGLSNAFGVEAGLGYAISASEGGDGGLIYSAGPFWRPLEAVLIAINYVNISFGEGSLGALMLSGRFSLSKK